MEAVGRWAEAGTGAPQLWVVDCAMEKKRQAVLNKHRAKKKKMEFYKCHCQQMVEVRSEGSRRGQTGQLEGDPKHPREGFKLGLVHGQEGTGPYRRLFLA